MHPHLNAVSPYVTICFFCFFDSFFSIVPIFLEWQWHDSYEISADPRLPSFMTNAQELKITEIREKISQKEIRNLEMDFCIICWEKGKHWRNISLFSWWRSEGEKHGFISDWIILMHFRAKSQEKPKSLAREMPWNTFCFWRNPGQKSRHTVVHRSICPPPLIIFEAWQFYPKAPWRRRMVKIRTDALRWVIPIVTLLTGRTNLAQNPQNMLLLEVNVMMLFLGSIIKNTISHYAATWTWKHTNRGNLCVLLPFMPALRVQGSKQPRRGFRPWRNMDLCIPPLGSERGATFYGWKFWKSVLGLLKH